LLLKTFSRVSAAAVLLTCAALAGPPLTTIQDTLYKADGTRFNGLVNIAWGGFEASDQSAIANQLITVKVVNGRLNVQLVPNTNSTPVVFYSVTYNSDGRVQFSETWAVPPSASPLRLRDVRVPTPSVNGADTGSGPVPESEVTGLVADLSARPVKGPAFAPGAVATVNSLGTIDSVAGNPTDCVHVDGTSGPCGTAQPGFMDQDLPAGIVDGSNNSFRLSAVPNPASSLDVYRNGLLQEPGTDYTLAGSNVIQFTAGNIPQPGDTLLANYRLSTPGTGASALFPSPQVLCRGAGGAVNTPSTGTLGSCTIPSGLLTSGDHVEIKFDLAHQGTSGGFTFQVLWGGTTILQRTAAAGDAQVSGHADAGLDSTGAQVSTQSWGTVLPLGATVGNAADQYSSGLVIQFQGAMGVAGETLTLRNYAVVRLP
jgi:hypothetical protein